MCARRGLGDKSGSAAVEFALVGPLLFSALIGVLQLGWAYHCASSVQYALERSSRVLTLDASAGEADVRDAMQAFLAGTANAASFDVHLDQVSVAGEHYGRLTARYTHTVSIPFVPSFDLDFTSVQLAPRPSP